MLWLICPNLLFRIQLSGCKTSQAKRPRSKTGVGALCLFEVCHVGDIFINLFVAVGANVIAYYICKWLDSRGKGQ